MRIKLDIPLTLSEMRATLNAKSKAGESEAIITHICTDTREIEAGDTFIALRGEKYNGNDYVSEAVRRGGYHISETDESRGIKVKNSNDALLTLASYYKSKLKMLKHTIAITGSVGKSTTKEFTRALLEGSYKTHATQGNLNNLFGVPYTILSAPKDTEALILEMGMNREGEIRMLSRCAKPTVSVITNIGTSHIGNLGSREGIARAKLEILDGMSQPVLIGPKEEKLLTEHLNYSFSDTDTEADLFARKETDGRVIFFKHGVKLFTVNFKVREGHLLRCLLPGILVGNITGVNISEFKKRISLFSDKNIRQKTISLHNIYIYEDCYNSSLESVTSALDHIKSLNEYSARSALLGDVMELGEYGEAIHRQIGAYAAKSGLKRLFFFGELSRFAAEEAVRHGFDKDRIFVNEDANAPYITARQIVDNCEREEIILFKASRAMRLERIIELIKNFDL